MSTRTGSTFSPPIPEAKRWTEGVVFPEDRPLINLSQAAPADPPPPELRRAMAEMMEDAETHLYGPVLGNSDLRAALAENWGHHYGAHVAEKHVAITSGCNQAFAAVMTAICDEGSEVILPTPWYFNHKMWLDMSGVTAVPLPCGPDMLPDVAAAQALVTPKTRAIALVSPNNPAGVEYPAELLHGFFDLCAEYGLRLIVDETYRDFDSRVGAPHDMLSFVGWESVLVQLYSFSKAFRLTGHRVGAIIGAPELLYQIEKFIDTVAICPPQIGQRAAKVGLETLQDWLAEERHEVLARRQTIAAQMPRLEAKGWKLRGLGAYFAYLEHPSERPASDLAPWMVQEAGILMLPATMFVPEGDPSGERCFRMAFANADSATLIAAFDRLEALDL